MIHIALADDQTLVRFGRDVDVAQALRVALGASPLHREVPGYERAGAVCVSAFLVDDEADAVAILADKVWEHSGLTSAGAWVFTGGMLPASAATVLRAADGGVAITDGPYTEGKEHLGGFTVISAATGASATWFAMSGGRASRAGPTALSMKRCITSFSQKRILIMRM